MRDKCYIEFVTVIHTYRDFLPGLKFESDLLILAILFFQKLNCIGYVNRNSIRTGDK